MPEKLIYKELCYKIVGLAYEIDNKLGFGFQERTYASAFEEMLQRDHIPYKREVYFPIIVNDKIIRKCYFDFIIDNKVVVELKSGTIKYRDVCTQLFQYLKSSGLKLGLVLRFTRNGVQTKRIPNLY